MSETYRACLVGCGRMGATIDDEVAGRPDSFLWMPFSHAAAAVACDRIRLVLGCGRGEGGGHSRPLQG